MSSYKFLPLLLLGCLHVLSPLAAQESIHYQVEARLLAYDAGETADRLIDWLEDEGGYFLVLREGYIEGRLPAERIIGVDDALKLQAEELLDYRLNAQDLSGELRRLEASISSREEVLKRNLEFLNDADFSSTLAIEKEVLQLIREIESLRGQLAVTRNRISYASLRLQLKNTGIIPRGDSESSFAWINSLDFYRFIERQPLSRAIPFFPRLGTPKTAPEKFSIYRRSKSYMAISPDGVKVSIRRVKPEPKMESEFWKEAVRNHLISRGYEPRGEVRSLGEERGFSMMWLLPYAGEEYIYSFAVAVQGKRLEIVESAGPLVAYDRRRSALEEWITKLYQ